MAKSRRKEISEETMAELEKEYNKGFTIALAKAKGEAKLTGYNDAQKQLEEMGIIIPKRG